MTTVWKSVITVAPFLERIFTCS